VSMEAVEILAEVQRVLRDLPRAEAERLVHLIGAVGFATLRALHHTSYFRWEQPCSIRGRYLAPALYGSQNYAGLQRGDESVMFSIASQSLRVQVEGIPEGADITIEYHGSKSAGSNVKLFTVTVHTPFAELAALVMKQQQQPKTGLSIIDDWPRQGGVGAGPVRQEPVAGQSAQCSSNTGDRALAQGSGDTA
jgi:hypothetical protein